MNIDHGRRSPPLAPGPSVVLPLLCSAVLVAAMFAAEIGRLYRVQSRQPSAQVLSRSSEEPQAAQQGRALQPGRGRHATSPWQIPWRGWKDILWRTYERIGEDRLLAVAAGVVFYGLLALFPAVTAMVSLYGLFAKASTINEHLSAAAGFSRRRDEYRQGPSRSAWLQRGMPSSASVSSSGWPSRCGARIPE